MKLKYACLGLLNQKSPCLELLRVTPCTLSIWSTLDAKSLLGVSITVNSNSNLCQKKSSGHLWTFSLQEPTDSPLQIPNQVFNNQLINWCLKKCSFLVLHSIKLGQTLRAVVSVRGHIHSRVSTFIVAPLTSVVLNRSTGLEGSAHTVQMWSIKPTVRYLATGDLGSINFRKNKETKTSIG